MSLNIINYPTTSLNASQVAVSDGVNTATLTPTQLTVTDLSVSGNINGSPYVAPVNYIDSSGLASGNITLPTLSNLYSNVLQNTVDGHNMHINATGGYLTINSDTLDLRSESTFNVGGQAGTAGQVLTSVGATNGYPIWTTPSAGYIDSSGNSSGNILMGGYIVNSTDSNKNNNSLAPTSSSIAGYSGQSVTFYAESQVNAFSNPTSGIKVDSSIIADSSSTTAGFYTDVTQVDGSYNQLGMGYSGSNTPTIQAQYFPASGPVEPLAIDFASPLNLVGPDTSSTQLTSVDGNLALNKTASAVGDYTIQGYLPINLSGTVYYLPLFQATV